MDLCLSILQGWSERKACRECDPATSTAVVSSVSASPVRTVHGCSRLRATSRQPGTRHVLADAQTIRGETAPPLPRCVSLDERPATLCPTPLLSTSCPASQEDRSPELRSSGVAEYQLRISGGRIRDVDLKPLFTTNCGDPDSLCTRVTQLKELRNSGCIDDERPSSGSFLDTYAESEITGSIVTQLKELRIYDALAGAVLQTMSFQQDTAVLAGAPTEICSSATDFNVLRLGGLGSIC